MYLYTIDKDPVEDVRSLFCEMAKNITRSFAWKISIVKSYKVCFYFVWITLTMER